MLGNVRIEGLSALKNSPLNSIKQKAEINYEWKFSSEETAACLKEAVEEIVEVHQRCSLTSPLQ